MAAIDTTRGVHTPASFAGGAIHKLVHYIATWRDIRNTRKALSQLTDRELDDIGISRSEIDTLIGKH